MVKICANHACFNHDGVDRGKGREFFFFSWYFIFFGFFFILGGDWALGGRVGEGGADIDEGKSIGYKLGIGEDPPV